MCSCIDSNGHFYFEIILFLLPLSLSECGEKSACIVLGRFVFPDSGNDRVWKHLAPVQYELSPRLPGQLFQM